MGDESPDEVVEGFSVALRAGNTGAATALFSREGCVITPDSTVIQGRTRIRSILQQLVDMPEELTIDQRTMLIAGDVAIGRNSWNLRTGASDGSVRRYPHSMIVLGRIDGVWRIAMVDPWRA